MQYFVPNFSRDVHFEPASQPTRSVVIYYYISDANGTAWGLTDSSGTVVWSADYDSYGNATFSGTIDQPLRMPGQYHDTESGLYYNLARYYEPTTGRYLSVDPLRDAEDYTYAGGNPLKYVDPTGEEVKVIAKDPKEAKILQDAYSRLTSTKRGQEICAELEASPEIFKIKPISQDAFYCPPGAKSAQCNGNARTVFIDPNNNVMLPTDKGLLETSKAVVLGHELGHAIGDHDDGLNRMNNVTKNENPIRRALGEEDRTSYTVPKIIWVPGNK